MAARVAFRVFVSGTVQGVAFRWSTQQKAIELGAQGWVRNLRDGRVEAQIEGPREVVDALLAWLEHGPSAARVDALQHDAVAAEGGNGFELRATV
ncbi:MAG: acylphosphatase [Planctomycetota bacterium]|nr:MAG: acylphosphatase [Planctomycetota bacterium]